MQQIISENNSGSENISTGSKKKKSLTNTLPIRAYFMACARNWYWFVISVIAFGCIAFLYGKSLPFSYEARALILLKSKDSNEGTQSQAFGDLGITTGNSFMPNEFYKIKSTDLIESVVNTMGNNVRYYGHVFLRDVSSYKSSPVQVTPIHAVTENFTITIVPKSSKEFEFQVSGDGGWKKAHFGNKVSTKYGPIAITTNKNFGDAHTDNYRVIAKVMTPRSLASQIKANLNAEQADKYSDVMSLSLRWDDKEEAIDILNTLIATYNQEGIEDKNQVASVTEKFIAERVDALSRDLNGVDSRVASLKTAAANRSVFASPTVGQQYADNAAEMDVQVSLASNIQSYLSQMSGNELIPSNTGIANTGIEGQITAYNELMQQYHKIAETSSSENPVMVEITQKLDAQRKNIMRGLSNYISSLRVQQSKAHSQESVAMSDIVAVPSQEKAITEVSRQQKIKETLYMYLLNKREENALQLAITEPNAKVMERATGRGPIAPVPSQILMVGLLIGLLLPAVILYGVFWYFSLDTTIHSRHDIEGVVDVPIVGELPEKQRNQRNKELVVTENGHDRITEALHIVRANIDYIVHPEPGKGVVMQFTSTMPGEGKSFVAANMALSYAYAGKRVVAVDLDLRKGRFSSYMGINDGGVGVSAYLSQKVADIDDVIIRNKISENLDLVCVGAIPPNPTNLLMGERFEEMIEKLRERYDYVILDTVPFSVIADAGMINRHADITIYVIRDGKVDKRYLEDLDRLNSEDKIKNLTFLVNDIKLDKKNYGYGSYGYGYGYGYSYGNYGYGYGSYGYGEEDNTSKMGALKKKIKDSVKKQPKDKNTKK